MAGWRPSTRSHRGGLILAEDGIPIAVATLALAEEDRRGLVALIERYGRRHPTGSVTVAPECISATVRYTARTPTYRKLREAVVIAVHAAT